MDRLVDQHFEDLREKPNRHLEKAVEIILGYGKDGAINSGGIDSMIAVCRAARRATVMRRVWVADLDNDGQVTRQEVAALVPTLSASLRGRLVMTHRAPDSDGDGTVSAAELRSYGQDQALRNLPESEAEGLRRLMLLDEDGDGWVSRHEADLAIAQFREGT